MNDFRIRSAYVPHDLKAPIVGTGQGALSGLTVAVKDMFDIAGERVGAGSPAWLEAHAPASDNSAVVDQVLDAGATIIGKTVCDEFFYSIAGINAHYGTPLNPRAPARIPGGSSSGSASAVSSGSCDIAIGSDTGGSVRVPAALCGVYEIRTSRGRMNLRGATPMAPSFDAGGWLAASAGTFGRAGSVLLQDWQPNAAEFTSLTVMADAFSNADPPVAELSRQFLRATNHLLPTSSELEVAGDSIDRWREALRVTQAWEVWRTFGSFMLEHKPKLGPGVAERMKIAASVTTADLAGARPILDAVTDRLEALTSNRTILVLPTCPCVAPLVGSSAEAFESYRVRTMKLVCFASISGLPQVTIPIGTLDGAPVGLSFLGWRNGEEALLELAKRLSPFVGLAA